MKAYVAITGIVFATLLVAHIARAAVEGAHVLGEPVFVLTTLASLTLTAWQPC